MHPPTAGVIGPDCVVALGSSGWAMDSSWIPCVAPTQDLYGATALWSRNLLQKISLFNTSSQQILPDTTKRCLPTSLETSAPPDHHWKQPVGAVCCLPFDRMSHKLALTEHSSAFTEPGACETSSQPQHIRRVLLVKDQLQEAAKHISPGA